MQSLARIFKAMGDDNRLRILETLLTNGETCACVLLPSLNISQPTLSHHMKILCDAGLVTYRRDGKSIYYKISRETAEEMLRGFGRVVGDLDKCECKCQEQKKCCCHED